MRQCYASAHPRKEAEKLSGAAVLATRSGWWLQAIGKCRIPNPNARVLGLKLLAETSRGNPCGFLRDVQRSALVQPVLHPGSDFVCPRPRSTRHTRTFNDRSSIGFVWIEEIPILIEARSGTFERSLS